MKSICTIAMIMFFTGNMFAQGVGINNNGSSPDGSAMLDVSSTTKGMLIPRMTFDQRNTIASPSEGLMVFCTNCGTNEGVLCVYSNGKWTNFTPYTTPAPTPGAHSSSQTTITWQWNSVTGATGYKWSTLNNYATAIDMGSATFYSESGLNCATTYTRYIWAYFQHGLSSVTVLTSGTASCGVWGCGDSFIDVRNGHTYNTVQIGTQCWLKENINYGTRIDGTVSQTNNAVVEKYCFGDLESNCDVYGALYSWGEMMNYTTSSNAIPSGRQGICPEGWHIPSDAEWCVLEIFLDASVVCDDENWRGTDAGGKMKEAGTIHWASNPGATNSSGFTALPSGFYDGQYKYQTNMTYYWSSREVDPQNSGAAIARSLYQDSSSIQKGSFGVNMANSIRCVKD